MRSAGSDKPAAQPDTYPEAMSEHPEQSEHPATPSSHLPAVPPVVDREAFQQALDAQVVKEKEHTRAGDRLAAARRRLPMVEVEDYEFNGPDGPVRLSELFGEHDLLMAQHFMFGPEWETGCPSCTWATDVLPAHMDRLDEASISFAMISQAPVEKLQAYRAERGWDHLWVSSGDTTFHTDWGWTLTDPEGYTGPVPGYSYYLRRDGKVYLTYSTGARGVEPILGLVNMQDRTVYGRQQDWEDSPEGWPQHPTYG